MDDADAPGGPARPGGDDGALNSLLGGGVAVSAISVWEVAHKMSRGQLTVGATPEQWLAALSPNPLVTLLPLTAGVAVRSRTLPPGLHEDPADRFIVATAVEHCLRLLTTDDRLLGYPHVVTIPLP